MKRLSRLLLVFALLVGTALAARATAFAESVEPPPPGDDDASSIVECEDGETGIVLPGPCPGPEATDDVVVAGNGYPGDGSASSTGASLPDGGAPAGTLAVKESMTFSLSEDALGRATVTFDAPRRVRIWYPRGGVVFKMALTGQGGLREYDVPDDWARQLSLSANATNCTRPALVNGNAAIWHGPNQLPGKLGVFAVITGTQIKFLNRGVPQGTTLFKPLTSFTITFDCDVR